jgi:hypothetical protein
MRTFAADEQLIRSQPPITRSTPDHFLSRPLELTSSRLDDFGDARATFLPSTAPSTKVSDAGFRKHNAHSRKAEEEDEVDGFWVTAPEIGATRPPQISALAAHLGST